MSAVTVLWRRNHLCGGFAAECGFAAGKRADR